MVLGVLPCRRDGDDVALALVAIHQHLARQRSGLATDDAVCLLFQPAVGILLVIDGVAFAVAQGIDEHRLALVAEHGVEALRSQIEAPRLRRRGQVVALEGQDAGILGGQVRRQQIIGAQGEAHLIAVRQGQGQPTFTGLQAGEVVGGDPGDPVLGCTHLIAIRRTTAGQHGVPLLGGEAAGGHQTGHHQGQRGKFHHLHLF
ncbi:hypothetical protein D3C80_1455990 [compost metagenome]